MELVYAKSRIAKCQLVDHGNGFLGVLDKDPYSYMYHLELGESARASGRLEEAQQHFEFVERHYPDAAPGMYLSLAAVYRAQGNLSKVPEILEKGRRVFPNDQAIARIAFRD